MGNTNTHMYPFYIYIFTLFLWSTLLSCQIYICRNKLLLSTSKLHTLYQVLQYIWSKLTLFFEEVAHFDSPLLYNTYTTMVHQIFFLNCLCTLKDVTNFLKRASILTHYFILLQTIITM